MWYSGYHDSAGGARIGYATSSDGMVWKKHNEDEHGNSDYVLDAGPKGAWDDLAIYPNSVLFDGTQYKMWYSGVSSDWVARIGCASSPDGVKWKKHNEDASGNSDYVLDVGQSGTWEGTGVHSPTVTFDGVKYNMWYTGVRDSSNGL